MDTDAPVVVARDLAKVYQVGSAPVVALNRVSLEIPRGTFAAVVGTSGSGKSTLLNMLGGLEKPTAGEVWVAGQPLHSFGEDELVKFRRENVGFVFQSFNLIASMTAMENVAWPLAFQGVGKQERLVRARAALMRMGLESHLDHRPNQMSGGQQQRVGIARALVVNPSIVFADEPTGNLDSRTAETTLNLFRQLCTRYHQTWVMVTHDNHLASFADMVIRISDGRIVSVERPNHDGAAVPAAAPMGTSPDRSR
ncbi:ABC transporter ATP-binding protein [Propionibacterium sp. oral taxon 192]|uniref:ABC transporter ATP-binding protein n=1 Tax=Propionibacterium sp. oral taxon 192 TaxID=671222 RepID=UPI00056817D4|nr:ABC transporter ATP-binding protein [Propionibacterium sp. oral taxon 192]